MKKNSVLDVSIPYEPQGHKHSELSKIRTQDAIHNQFRDSLYNQHNQALKLLLVQIPIS